MENTWQKIVFLEQKVIVNRIRIFTLLMMLIAVSLPGVSRAVYSTSEISEASFAFTQECLEYCIIGVCVKLICTPYGCTTKTDPYVRHRLPDVVVSAYNQPGEISWTEASDLYGSAVLSAAQGIISALTGFDIGGGYKAVTQQQGEGEEDELDKTNNMKFKEVSVIGNPVIDAVNSALSDEYFCESEVTAFEPYMQTELDAFTWRLGIPELLYSASWVPGMREIGTLFPPQSWGGVHPRTGWVLQEYDSLGAAVNAQRAIDVATREDQPHVYSQIPGVEPSDEDTDKWGMLAPRLEPGHCITFGKDLFYNFEREGPKTDEGYGWLYWANHECCPGVGVTVAKIPFEPICFDIDEDGNEKEDEEDEEEDDSTEDEEDEESEDPDLTPIIVGLVPEVLEQDEEAEDAGVIGGGFVWKPVSEGDGNLVVLLPSDYGNVSVALYDANGNLIEQGRYVGRTNGGRPTYRFNMPGAAYGQYALPLTLLVGGEQFIITNPGARIG